jgi:hypothetical protein
MGYELIIKINLERYKCLYWFKTKQTIKIINVSLYFAMQEDTIVI